MGKARVNAPAEICPCCGRRIPGSAKSNRDKRDLEIFRLYKHGHSYRFLMEKFNLSASAIRWAIRRGERRGEALAATA